jgi:hypothetical protein
MSTAETMTVKSGTRTTQAIQDNLDTAQRFKGMRTVPEARRPVYSLLRRPMLDQ